jgi:type IV pilus assembly protein PilN
MLKINLLPVRQLKKRAKAKKQLSGILVLFMLVIAVLVFTGALQAQKISGLESNVASLQKEKDSYTSTLQKIAKLKKDSEELIRKTGIINQLKTDSSLTVRVIDEVANRIDNQRMWLESLNQDHTVLRLSGVALDNQTIAQFMDNFKASPFVRDVVLASSSLKVVSGRNLKSFEINCTVAEPEKPAPKSKDVK